MGLSMSYDAEHLEAGLTELAIWGGSAKNASRTLKERGIDIPPSTLQTWKRTHVERLAEVEEQVLGSIRKRMAAQQAQIAQAAAEVTMQIIDRTRDEVNEIPARDLPAAARNMEVTGATAIDKHAVINDLPTEIKKSENVADLVERVEQTEKALREKYPNLFEGSAEEIPEAEVVDDAPVQGPVRQLSRVSSR